MVTRSVEPEIKKTVILAPARVTVGRTLVRPTSSAGAKMNETKKKKLRTFPGLEANDFQHPWDATATEALKSVPGLNVVVAKIMEYGLERIFYLHNTASNVRVTARQFPRLYRALGWGCKIIGVEEPEVYVALDPTP